MTQENNQIKAVFFDIDGTLVSHKEGKIPESTREWSFYIVHTEKTLNIGT